ncbi:hypothetical protein HDV06_005123 [Boothiomyces sp. JEL0866]|nr:hypothetical protein HDV06_005123 [Boothiomyces sp. JEL0866]
MTLLEYTVDIRQEPTHGRESGTSQPFLKTHLTPTLTLQVIFPQAMTPQQLLAMNLVCHLTLYTENGQQNSSVVIGKRPNWIRAFIQNLTGECTSAGKVYNDPKDGNPYIFFTFPDVLIRTKGVYRLKCHIINMDNIMQIPVEVMTQPFRIETSENFKKLGPPTISELTRSFTIQGERYASGMSVKPQKEQPKKQFKNLALILKEADTCAQFRAYLKTQNFQTNNIATLQYFLFYEQTEKRIQIYRSGQKCGDDREKGQEILNRWARDILSAFGELMFEGKKLGEMELNVEGGEQDLFASSSKLAFDYIQQLLDSQN